MQTIVVHGSGPSIRVNQTSERKSKVLVISKNSTKELNFMQGVNIRFAA